MKNLYASKEGQELLRMGDEEQKAIQSFPDEAMRKAAKEGRGLTNQEIENVIDDAFFHRSHRPAVAAASRKSSAVKRFVARKNKETGKTEWVLLK